ncbi:MAG: hypothetical protein AAF664_15065, partial [Planctomycetota bacterium]
MGSRGRILSIPVLGLLTVSCLVAESITTVDSFEAGEGMPNGWRQGAALPGVSYVYDLNNASEGERSLSIQKSANRYFPIAQWFKTFELDGSGKKLTITSKVKASKATKSIIDVQFLDNSGGVIGHEWVCYIGQKSDRDRPATHDWKIYEGEAEIPEDASSFVVALQTYGPGKVWFDELAISNGESTKKVSYTPETSVQNSVASSTRPKSLQLESGSWTRFIMMPPAKSVERPADGYPLLLVLPGGDGSVNFQSFIRSIHKQALNEEFLTIQMIAPPQITWPTKRTYARYAPTVEAIEGIVKQVGERVPINLEKVYALGWSSGGPPVYEALLRERSSLSGAFIAMSVFKPEDYPSLSSASGKRVFLLHS